MSRYNSKPGVDWNAIRTDFAAGLSTRECAKRTLARDGVPITHRAIQKRGAKEGWDAKSAIVAATARLPSIVAQAAGAATTTTRTEPAARAILESLQKGLPYRTAASLAGISERTLTNWRETDAEFAELCERSIETWHASMVGHVDAAAPRDWKAAQWRLQSHAKTKGDYAEKSGGTNIQVNLNIGRAEDAPVVTVEHKA
jgi:hypothetical protein